MSDQNRQLFNRIPVLRAETKMTQKDLAEKAGVSRQTINSIEKNRFTPSLTLSFDIANVFEVGIDEVFQYKKVLRDQEEDI